MLNGFSAQHHNSGRLADGLIFRALTWLYGPFCE